MLKKIIFLFTTLSLLAAKPILAATYFKVALLASSTQYNEDKIDKIKQALKKKGYTVTTKYLSQVVSDFGYVNTDHSRAAALKAALLDKSIDIIWMVRGGAGAMNLIPSLYAEKARLKKLNQRLSLVLVMSPRSTIL